jgi:hypothetical protein
MNSPDDHPQTSPYQWWFWHDEPPQPGADRPGLTRVRAARAASTRGDGA